MISDAAQSGLRSGLEDLRRAASSLAEALSARKEDRLQGEIKYELAAARFKTALIAAALAGRYSRDAKTRRPMVGWRWGRASKQRALAKSEIRRPSRRPAKFTVMSR